jgi:hypothetical protein
MRFKAQLAGDPACDDGFVNRPGAVLVDRRGGREILVLETRGETVMGRGIHRLHHIGDRVGIDPGRQRDAEWDVTAHANTDRVLEQRRIAVSRGLETGIPGGFARIVPVSPCPDFT